jgi:DNA-binding transcriptional LysR family regulator
MELRDLQCFVAIAEDLSFTRAALRIRTAQPALSLRLRQFEEELGALLFARTKRRVSLTEAGAALLPMARQILESADQAARTVRLVGAGHAGVLRIGAFYSAIYTVLPPIIRNFAVKYPNVEIQIKELIVTQQVKMLRAAEIDVGIVRSERPLSDLQTIDLLKENLFCVLHVDNPLARHKVISLRQLAEEPLITLDPEFNSDFYAATLAAFAAQNLSLRTVKKAPDMHLVLGLVSAGLGFALVPSSLTQINHRFIVFRELKEKLPRMTMQLAWKAESTAPIVAHFAQAAAELFGTTRPRLAK